MLLSWKPSFDWKANSSLIATAPASPTFRNLVGAAVIERCHLQTYLTSLWYEAPERKSMIAFLSLIPSSQLVEEHAVAPPQSPP